MHTHEGVVSGAQPKPTKPMVSNQHQLTPIQNNDPLKQGGQQGQNRGGYKGNNLGSRQGQGNDGYYHENNFQDNTSGSGRRGGTALACRPWNNNNDHDSGQSQNHNSQRGRGCNQNKGRGHGYNSQQGQQQAYDQGYQPAQGQYLYMATPQVQSQTMISHHLLTTLTGSCDKLNFTTS